MSSRVRDAPFALRVTQRREGLAAIVYRRRPDANGHDRLQRLAAISPLAFTAGSGLLREAVSQTDASLVRAEESPRERLVPGPYYPLDADWGARVATYAIISSGLRNGERLLTAASHLRHADANEAAWWLGLLSRDDNGRALRALRILTEAVE